MSMEWTRGAISRAVFCRRHYATFFPGVDEAVSKPTGGCEFQLEKSAVRDPLNDESADPAGIESGALAPIRSRPIR